MRGPKGRSAPLERYGAAVVSVAIAMLNMVNQMGAILVATGPAYSTAFGVEGSHGLVLLFMDLHFHGYLIAQMSWLWLFALGMLAYRSGMFPRILGVVLMLGTVSYVVHVLAQFLDLSFAPALASALFVPELLSEVSLLLYLMIKGVKTPVGNAPTTVRAESS